MKLYIAEKPSLGKAIAAALPKPHKNQQGFIEVGNGDVVSWCIGHILEQADPEQYDERFKKWQTDHLPIIPETWQLKPKTKTRSQLTILRKLVKSASSLVHAGDPDREGQLLVDEVIDFLKVSKTKKLKTERLLINDLNLPAVKRALSTLQSNQEFIPLSISALARSRADWLYGINLTRAYTLQGQKTGFNGVLSVGRVQTPILGLVVHRQKEIDNFKAADYFEVNAHLVTEKQEPIIAKWKPSEACTPYMDKNSHVLNKALAENVIRRITQQPGEVTKLNKQDKKLNAPLPYNLSSLQIDAAKQFSMNAKLVLDVCQALYEKHKLITYPRSDCRYLPLEHFSQSPTIIDHLGKSSAEFSTYAKNAQSTIKSKAWNNSKVSAHHAIIPTLKSSVNVNLNSFEKNIYLLIAKQYLAQFYPAYLYQQTSVEITIAKGLFTASAKIETQLGWKALFTKKENTSSSSNVHDRSSKSEGENTLPNIHQGQKLFCEQGELLAKTTQPPKLFTDATLLGAMTGISRFVSDPEIKKILKETDGLGTEATRANIIELLFKRGFLKRIGKAIQATDIGIALIDALPTKATLPDMTAQWEATLNDISEKKTSYSAFMNPLHAILNDMVIQAQQQSFHNLPKVAFKPKRKRSPGKATRYKKRSPAKS